MGTTRVLPGYRQLDPLRQGALDRLCGLYAIINAASLAAYPDRPLSAHKRRMLFDQGMDYFGTSTALLNINLYGIRERRWMGLRDHMLSELRRSGGPTLHAIPLMPHRSGSLETVLSAIVQAIDGGAPVSLVLWGAYDHCTVVAGYTPSSFLLFDSWGFRHIARRSLGLRRPGSRARHKISVLSLAAITAETPSPP